MFDGRRSSLEISVFYVEFFIRILFNRIIKLKKTKYYELPGNHAQTSIQEFLFLCHVLWKRPCYCKSRKPFPSKFVVWIFLIKLLIQRTLIIVIIIIIIKQQHQIKSYKSCFSIQWKNHIKGIWRFKTPVLVRISMLEIWWKIGILKTSIIGRPRTPAATKLEFLLSLVNSFS